MARTTSSEVTTLLAEIADLPVPLDPVNLTTRIDDDNEEEFPKLQILLLCYARVFEPLAFFAIFPLLNQMIYDTGEIAESDVGFYSGLIESLFSITQMLFLVPFGRAADTIGRKPVLVFSIVGTSIFTALFGMSRTIKQMIILRCCAGAFAGMIATMGTMVAENSTLKTRAISFSWFGTAGNVGVFLGPLVGGTLAEPAKWAPVLQGGFFDQYPYALPTFATGAIGLSAAFGCLFLRETLKKKAAVLAVANDLVTMSVWQILKAPGVILVLSIYGQFMVLIFALTSVIPVFWFTSVQLGGYGFRPLWISIFSALSGLCQVVWLLFIFPGLQRRFGTGFVVRYVALIFPVYFALFPVCNILLRNGLKAEFWTLAPFVQIFGSGIAMCVEAMQLCLNDVNPRPDTLGSLNALALTYISFLRAWTPAAWSSLYAFGVRKGILGGHLAWVVMFIQGVYFWVLVRWLPPAAEGKIKDSNSEPGEIGPGETEPGETQPLLS